MDYRKIINEVKTFEEFKLAKSKILSKEGPIFILQEKIKTSTGEERTNYGKQIKLMKEELDKLFEEKMNEITELELENKIKNDLNDIHSYVEGEINYHPLFLIQKRFRDWFSKNGYFEAKESELETDFYNFEQLNIPKNHPSRDMQDTLYIDESLLLRTHNTGITARMLEKHKNKNFSCFTIGKVYRNDDDDQTHSHQFSQVDLVSIGNHSMQTLMWTIKSLLSYVFEQELEIRFRPSFFPFTEPSIEVDIFYKNRWIEVLGAGMVNEKILELAGYKKGFIGIAVGIGIERIAMIKYGIKDIREFFKNDLRMIKQFK